MPERYSMIVKKFSSQSLRRRCVVGAVARFEDVDGNDDAACTDADETSTTVDSANDVGSYSSITIGFDGNPVIAHHDFASGDLRVTHLSRRSWTENVWEQ